MAAEQPSGCLCLCSVNHAGVSGVCTGQMDTYLTFQSPSVGKVDVAMCSACVAATLSVREGGAD